MPKIATALIVGLLLAACGPMTEAEKAAFAEGMAQQSHNWNANSSSSYQPPRTCYKYGNVVQCY